jgi:hypothetical protein
MHPIASDIDHSFLFKSSNIGHDIAGLDAFILQSINQLLGVESPVAILLDKIQNHFRFALAANAATPISIFFAVCHELLALKISRVHASWFRHVEMILPLVGNVASSALENPIIAHTRFRSPENLAISPEPF